MEKFSQEKKNEHLPIDKDRCSRLQYPNYCVPGIMSRCSAGTLWENQKKCRFSKKSSVSDRCMHYIVSLDGHCDCVDAQREIRMLLALEKDDV
jgi:hypothetical protein